MDREGGIGLFGGSELALGAGGDADALDFPLKHDSAVSENALAHRFAQPLDVRGRCASVIDEKIAMHLRHMRAADAEAPGSPRRRSASTRCGRAGF